MKGSTKATLNSPPYSGHNLSVTAFGRFRETISANATIYFFLVADAGVAFWGKGGFCNHTTVIQTVDGLTRESCPPLTGPAFLKSTLFPEEDLQPVIRSSALFPVAPGRLKMSAS